MCITSIPIMTPNVLSMVKPFLLNASGISTSRTRCSLPGTILKLFECVSEVIRSAWSVGAEAALGTFSVDSHFSKYLLVVTRDMNYNNDVVRWTNEQSRLSFRGKMFSTLDCNRSGRVGTLPGVHVGGDRGVKLTPSLQIRGAPSTTGARSTSRVSRLRREVAWD
jgi:hypothetical protein